MKFAFIIKWMMPQKKSSYEKTVKISTFSHKDTIDGKDYDWKDLQFVWNDEFSDLFELGIFEQDKKQGAREPGYGGSLFQFNSQKIRDG